ncbi:hypothetical protein [Rickettsia sp. wq]|uniref:hypothetical protein n=1 Tax=Rickettsia sp. wq TaxID=1851203 RepID=UPI000A87C68F|nr:hypothetical protein [Rickettsia sp. wq]
MSFPRRRESSIKRDKIELLALKIYCNLCFFLDSRLRGNDIRNSCKKLKSK